MKTQKKPRRQLTLQRVADHAGVSKATASMILSGRAGYRKLFNPETVRKVCRSAAALKYRTNVFASSLGRHKTPFFALVVPGSGYDTWQGWSYEAFESLLVGGVLAVSAETNTYPIVLTLAADATEARIKAVDDIISGGVFGTIARTPPPALVHRLHDHIQEGYPAVVVFPECGFKWPSNVVDADNVGMGRLAGEILARNGRKKWSIICFKSDSLSQEARRRGFQEAARRHGATVRVIRVEPTSNPSQIGELLIPRLLRTRPDGLFGVNGAASVGAMVAVTRMGRRPGEDVGVLGVDCSMWAEEAVLRCSITSLGVSWKEAGKVAMTKLLEMRSTGESTFPSLFLKPVITPGRSCPVPSDVLEQTEAGILSA